MILLATRPQWEHFALPYLRAIGGRTLLTESPPAVHKAAALDVDVVWIEWANEFAVEILRRRLPAFTIVRVHDYEVRRGLVRAVNWRHVDLIWFINRDTQRDFNRLVASDRPQIFLPNAVDPEPFPLVAADSKHLAMLSVNAQPRKRYERAVELMKLLPEYRLTIRTEPTHGIPELIKGAPNVQIDARPLNPDLINDKRDVVAFFRGKSHVLSTSDHEGFHYAVAEGMLCGCAPVVYDWEWGQARDFWDPFVCGSLGEMAARIRMTKGSTSSSQLWRRYVTRHFAAEKLAPRLLEMIESRRKAA